MNYRKITSRLSGLPKIDVRATVFASCVVAALLIITVPPPYPAHAQQGNGDRSQMGDRSPAAPLATPEPYFSVTWTVDANSFSDLTEGARRTVTRHFLAKHCLQSPYS